MTDLSKLLGPFNLEIFELLIQENASGLINPQDLIGRQFRAPTLWASTGDKRTARQLSKDKRFKASKPKMRLF